MTLDTPTRSLEVLLTGASSAPLRVVWSHDEVRYVAGTATHFGQANGASDTNGTTPVQVVPPPGPNRMRRVKQIAVWNQLMVPVELVFRMRDGSSIYTIKFVRLPPGYMLEFEDKNGWRSYDMCAGLQVKITPTP